MLLALAGVHLLGIPLCLVQSPQLAFCLGIICVGVGHLAAALLIRGVTWRLTWLLLVSALELGCILALTAWSPAFTLLALFFVGSASTFLGRPGLLVAPAALFVLLIAGGVAVSFGWTFDAETLGADFVRMGWSAAAVFALLVGLMTYVVHFALGTLASSVGYRRIARVEVDQSRARLESVRLSRERVEARVRDAQKIQTVDQLSDSIAHQLSNAITTVRGATELLRQASSTREIHDAAAEVALSVERTADMVRGLLVFSRREQDCVTPLSLVKELASLRQTLEKTLPANITFDTRALANPIVVADRKRFGQLVLSLVLNGRDAIAGSGAVSLTVDTVEIASDTATETVTPLAPGSYAMLVVADDGCGMTPEVAARAFEPFFSTKPAQRHEGLGLFVVFGLLRQWGGTLQVDSEPDRGTRVTAYLPVARDGAGNAFENAPPPTSQSSHPATSIAPREGSVRARATSTTSPRPRPDAPKWVRASLGRSLLVVGIAYLASLAGILLTTAEPIGTVHLLCFAAGTFAFTGWRAKGMSHAVRTSLLIALSLAPSAWAVVEYSASSPAALLGLACGVLFAAAYSRATIAILLLAACTGLLLVVPLLSNGAQLATTDPSLARNWWRVACLVPIICVAATWLLRDLIREAIRGLRDLDVALDDLSGAHQRLRSEGDSLAVAEIVAERAVRVETAGRLAGAVAHDLGNALAAVVGWASLLLDDPAPEPSDVETAMLAFDESADYAETLLLQLTTRQGQMDPGPTNVSKVVSRFDPVLKRLVRGNITVDLRLDPGCCAPIGAGNLKRVLLNLVSNARDAMPQKGTLTISVRCFETRVRLSVRDTGVGMDQATQDRLFEAFYTTKREGQGTGLGLHSVARIMEETGGEVSVISEPGVGSEVTLEWPAAADPGQASDPTAPRPELTHSAVVLLAEDDETVRSVMSRGLTRAGFSVVQAADGDEASVQLRERTDWDALCIDAVMPGRASPDLIRDFLGRYPGRPVLVVSGHFAGEIVTLAELGEVRFLHKPLGSRDLVAVLDEELARATRSTPASSAAKVPSALPSDPRKASLKDTLERKMAVAPDPHRGYVLGVHGEALLAAFDAFEAAGSYGNGPAWAALAEYLISEDPSITDVTMDDEASAFLAYCARREALEKLREVLIETVSDAAKLRAAVAAARQRFGEGDL